MVFHWSLNNSKSLLVPRTLLSILSVLNKAVVWIVSTLPPTSNPFNNLLVTVLKASITIGIIVTFMFYSFFNSLARSRYLSFFSLSFNFIQWSTGTVKSAILQVLFFCFVVDYYKFWYSGRDYVIRVYVKITEEFIWIKLEYMDHHHHHVVPQARISLTLSHHFSLSSIASGRSSGLHPVSSHSCCMNVRAGRPAFAWQYVGSIGGHHLWARPCFSSSVLYVLFV